MWEDHEGVTPSYHEGDIRTGLSSAKVNTFRSNSYKNILAKICDNGDPMAIPLS